VFVRALFRTAHSSLKLLVATAAAADIVY